MKQALCHRAKQIVLGCILAILSVLIMASTSLRLSEVWSLPASVTNMLKTNADTATLKVRSAMNPFYLRGHFKRGLGEQYVMLLEGESGTHLYLVSPADKHIERITFPSGTEFAPGDCEAMDYWYVLTQDEARAQLGQVFEGEVILVGKSEAASRVIYSKNHKWSWDQVGD